MELAVQAGSEAGRVFQIDRPLLVLGRQVGSDVQLSDTQVSRRHLQLENRNGALYVTDLGSANGSFINGRRLATNQTELLRNGDTLRVGDTSLVVRGYAPDANSAVTSAGTNYEAATQVRRTSPNPQPTYNPQPSNPSPNYNQPPIQPNFPTGYPNPTAYNPNQPPNYPNPTYNPQSGSAYNPNQPSYPSQAYNSNQPGYPNQAYNSNQPDQYNSNNRGYLANQAVQVNPNQAYALGGSALPVPLKPKKNRTGLVAVIVLIAIVLIGGVVLVSLNLLNGSKPTPTPQVVVVPNGTIVPVNLPRGISGTNAPPPSPAKVSTVAPTPTISIASTVAPTVAKSTGTSGNLVSTQAFGVTISLPKGWNTQTDTTKKEIGSLAPDQKTFVELAEATPLSSSPTDAANREISDLKSKFTDLTVTKPVTTDNKGRAIVEYEFTDTGDTSLTHERMMVFKNPTDSTITYFVFYSTAKDQFAGQEATFQAIANSIDFTS